MNSKLNDLIKALHNARTSMTGYKKSEETILQEIDKSDLGQALSAAAKNRKFWQKEAESVTEELRKQALVEFSLNHEEKILGVIHVKEEPVVPEYPMEQAVEWAKKNAPFLVVESIDKSSFETLVLSGKIPWLKPVPQSRVTKIASDLTPALSIPETQNESSDRSD